jgi:hypothetical protein
MPNKIVIRISTVVDNEPVELNEVELDYTPDVDMDVELELVHDNGGPIMRPKTPPRL